MSYMKDLDIEYNRNGAHSYHARWKRALSGLLAIRGHNIETCLPIDRTRAFQFLRTLKGRGDRNLYPSTLAQVGLLLDDLAMFLDTPTVPSLQAWLRGDNIEGWDPTPVPPRSKPTSGQKNRVREPLPPAPTPTTALAPAKQQAQPAQKPTRPILTLSWRAITKGGIGY